jgi:hypothetical protein
MWLTVAESGYLTITSNAQLVLQGGKWPLLALEEEYLTCIIIFCPLSLSLSTLSSSSALQQALLW